MEVIVCLMAGRLPDQRTDIDYRMLLRAESLDINSALLSRGRRRGGAPEWGSEGQPGTGASGVRTGRERGVRDRLAHPERSAGHPHQWIHQGTMIPWSQCHKLMKSMGDSGPARTRTWDQGIMSNHFSSRSCKEVEEA